MSFFNEIFFRGGNSLASYIIGRSKKKIISRRLKYIDDANEEPFLAFTPHSFKHLGLVRRQRGVKRRERAAYGLEELGFASPE